jgi:hypothetical protein
MPTKYKRGLLFYHSTSKPKGFGFGLGFAPPMADLKFKTWACSSVRVAEATGTATQPHVAVQHYTCTCVNVTACCTGSGSG